MFKVVIIDDDPIIRKGLSMMINWQDLGFEICATARDGKEGIEILHRHQPQLLISDIQMPGMNGLEMIELIRKSYPDMQVIIVTGFRNFDYARKALKLGVLEILLKPTCLEELVETLHQASGLITQIDEDRHLEKQRVQESRQNLFIRQQRLFKEYALGLKTFSANSKKELEKTGLTENPYCLMLTQCRSDQEDREGMFQKAIAQVLGDFSSEKIQITSFRQDRHLSGFMAIFKDTKIEDCDISALKEILQQAIEILRSNLGIVVNVMLSSASSEWKDIRDRYKEAEGLSGMTFLYGKEGILLSPSAMEEVPEEIDRESQQNRFLEWIKEGKQDELRTFFDSRNPFWCNLLDEREIKKLFSSIIHRIFDIRMLYLLPEDEAWEPVSWIDRIMHSETLDDALSLLSSYSIGSAEEIFGLLHQGKSDYVDRAKEFIKQNYHQELTLQQTADYACISSFYLSRLFKQNVGISFSSYLNQQRIEEAKILLERTELKFFEIGERIGVPDPYYFSKLFKRMEGVTPSQFKKNLTDS